MNGNNSITQYVVFEDYLLLSRNKERFCNSGSNIRGNVSSGKI